MYYSILKESLVVIAKWIHLFPSRTQKLSTFTLMIVGFLARKSRKSPISFLLDLWRSSSVGRASALQAEGQRFEPVDLHHFADLAQSVEQLTCNQ